LYGFTNSAARGNPLNMHTRGEKYRLRGFLLFDSREAMLAQMATDAKVRLEKMTPVIRMLAQHTPRIAALGKDLHREIARFL
jgi:hypothetical protein